MPVGGAGGPADLVGTGLQGGQVGSDRVGVLCQDGALRDLRAARIAHLDGGLGSVQRLVEDQSDLVRHLHHNASGSRGGLQQFGIG
jgi:hypothetical protein